MPDPWEPYQSFEKLAAAVDSNDKATVRELVGALVAYVNSHHECYDTGEAGNILNVLRRRRLFEEMRRAADAFLNNGCLSYKIRKYYAQALVDLGYLAAAEDVLVNLQKDAAADYADAALDVLDREDAVKEWAESCGLLGRVYKDRYVNARAPDVDRNRVALNDAINYYYGCYTAEKRRMSKRHWHGINAVALARRARHDHVDVTTPFDVSGTAETILDEVRLAQKVNHGEIDIWAAANAMEACIALQKWDEAYAWGKEYAAHEYDAPGTQWAKKVDAFEVAGTLRQLEEVWLLDVTKDPGRLLLPLLRTRLQKLEGFEIRVSASEPIGRDFLAKQAESLEKQFGGQFLSFRTYCEGVSRARAVARIGPSEDEHFGTGFLIDGSDLHPRLAGQRLLVTCDHVVSERNWGALKPGRAVVTFRTEDNSVRRLGVKAVLWSSPEGQLDVSVLRLDGDVSDLPVVPWADHAPGSEEQRVLIFGHAVGGALSFSLGDNRLVDSNERYLQYRAPTVGGSSGSPVFNSEWELVAVHHSGGYSMKRLTGEGTHEANEGSLVFAVREELAKDPQRLFEASSPGQTAGLKTSNAWVRRLRRDDVVLDRMPEAVRASLEERRRYFKSLTPDANGREFRLADLRRWRPGETLTVAFLGGDKDLHRDIAEATRAITDACHIKLDFGFDEAAGAYRSWSEDDKEYRADIRVSFDKDGFWSLVGTDSVDPKIGDPGGDEGGSPHQRSLNLGGFTDFRPDDWRGVVRHEFLHALAFEHEHQNMRGPCSADFRWEDDDGYKLTLDADERAVPDAQGLRPGIYTYLAWFPNYWPKEMVDHNLLTEEDPGSVAGPFDSASVMLYQFPPLFYRTDNSPCAPTGDGVELSGGDIRALRLLYGDRPEDLETFRERMRDLARAIEAAHPDVQKESSGGESFAHTAMRRIARALGE